MKKQSGRGLPGKAGFCSLFALCVLLSASIVRPIRVGHAQTVDDLRPRAEALLERGIKLIEDSQLMAARDLFLHSLDLARKLGDDSLISLILIELANVSFNLGEYDRALALAEESLSFARLTGDRGLEAKALDQLGNAYHYKDDHPKALEKFQQAVQLMRQAGDRLGEATALKDVGITYKYLGQFEKSIDYINEALEIFRQLNARSQVSSALVNIGPAYEYLGAYRRALDYYEQSLEMAQRDKDLKGTFSALARIGYITSNRDRSLHCFQQALDIADKMKEPGLQAWVLLGTSEVLTNLGRTEEAAVARRRALRYYLQTNDLVGISAIFRELGYIHTDSDPAVAIDYFQRSIAISEKAGARLYWDLYAALARAYWRHGNLDRAIELYQKAIAEVELTRDYLSSKQHRAGFLSRFQNIYHELFEALTERYGRNPEARDDLRAFSVFERAKARALLEAMSEVRPDIERELEPELRQRQDGLTTSITLLQKDLIRPDLARDKREMLVKQMDRAEQELDRLIIDITQQNPRYAGARYPSTPSVSEAQSLIDAHTALVAYLVTQSTVFAFVITAKSFHIKRLTVLPTALAARVQNYNELIARDDSAAWPQVSRRLYSELLTPLREYLPPEIDRLIVIPDGLLHYLPFETLIDPAAEDHRYLLDDFNISYSPSISVFARLNAPRLETASTEGGTDLLMFANPALARGLAAQDLSQGGSEETRGLFIDEGLQIEPIPHTADEARKIIQYVDQGSKIYTGNEASERRIKSEQLDQFRILHFATHGLINQKSPSRSALVLAAAENENEDGFLQVREIYDLKLSSDMVVLSACRTARGEILAGEGVQGLAQAFFYAGAQSVVASLWDVNDESTTVFMEAFYRHLSEGLSKIDALRAAKLDLLRNSSTSAPRYWAPFILIGEPNRSMSIGDQSGLPQVKTSLVMSFALLMLFIALVLFRRSRERSAVAVNGSRKARISESK